MKPIVAATVVMIERGLRTVMFERYTEAARRTIFYARHEASQFGTPEIWPEFLLLGIFREDRERVLHGMGESIDLDAIRRRIEEEIPRGEKIQTTFELPLKEASKRVLAYAAEEMEHLNQQHLDTIHILAGLVREKKSLAATILKELGITLEKLRTEAACNVPTPPPPVRGTLTSQTPHPLQHEPSFRDLTSLAKSGQLLPLIGRDRELDRIIQILSRRTRRNAVLIGESGVGKTAIVEGLAQRIAAGTVPQGLIDRKLLAIDASALLGPRHGPELATHYRGAVLFVHGLFDMGGAGYSWGVLEAMRILEPLLARGSIQMIATGTPAGYRDLMDKAVALGLQFEVVSVVPPNHEEAAAILHGAKAQYEQYHEVTFSDEAIEAALLASARFLRHRALPDRALDLLDDAGAQVSLRRAAGSTPEEREVRRRLRVAIHQMENAIAMHEFDKARELSKQEEAERRNLEQWLDQHKTDPARSGVVTAQDIVEVVAGRAGAPVSVVLSVMRQGDASEIERIAKQLIVLVPQGREWLEPLAAYLAGCAAEDAGKLADTIREIKSRK